MLAGRERVLFSHRSAALRGRAGQKRTPRGGGGGASLGSVHTTVPPPPPTFTQGCFALPRVPRGALSTR
ncbi:hypothetical protein SD17_00615 [Treponema pallidum subsp. pallidum]|nr:hypothetical protein SD24_00615 [Treponema pallidum subsp. pallidum]ANI47961.1 hypothetical protein SD17_00615 [Treponema pallidum subsp. pallidum]AOF57073.1 hypothetical protein A9D11_00620 [Treponema pallidum subsp. pallidum]AOF70453.1 hypothetical protein A8P38_00620 [Treponema pallidum subsp. pallidum]